MSTAKDAKGREGVLLNFFSGNLGKADELMSKEFEGLSLDISGMTENRIDLVVQ
ncbi:MAG: hypothetical protein GY801_33250 [bacterium]|nr:hypothetical protein [bacterium]